MKRFRLLCGIGSILRCLEVFLEELDNVRFRVSRCFLHGIGDLILVGEIVGSATARNELETAIVVREHLNAVRILLSHLSNRRVVGCILQPLLDSSNRSHRGASDQGKH